jgi:hypothetical protein
MPKGGIMNTKTWTKFAVAFILCLASTPAFADYVNLSGIYEGPNNTTKLKITNCENQVFLVTRNYFTPGNAQMIELWNLSGDPETPILDRPHVIGTSSSDLDGVREDIQWQGEDWLEPDVYHQVRRLYPNDNNFTSLVEETWSYGKDGNLLRHNVVNYKIIQKGGSADCFQW